MFPLTCQILDHQLDLLLIATVVCVSGSFVTLTLFLRGRVFDGMARIGWLFLTAICAGATTWTTHFIAMLGFRPDVEAIFDPFSTAASIVVAILGAGFGFGVVARRQTRLRTLLGGVFVGASIAGMHYLGMFGYRIDGIVTWSLWPVALSVAAAGLLSMASLATLRALETPHRKATATGLLVLAILSLHFLGMEGLTVTPLSASGAIDAASTQALAAAVAIVAMLVIGAGLATCIIDMDARIRSDKTLVDMAFTDALTGLPNRRALEAKMDEAFREHRWFKLMMIDLDHFKQVNDNYGHAVGDKLLMEVACRIRHVIGPDARAYRIGGDELAVLIFRDRETAMHLANELVVALREPIELEGQRVVSGCSIGLCAFEHASDAETLMRRADAALYEAKRRGRGQVFRYTPGMLEAAVQRTQLESDLQTAVQCGEMHLVFQPIVDLGSMAVLGYEALLRWNHPLRGPISPGEFIPVAEASGAIVGIGKWVLEEACRTAATWPDGRYIAVNVSATQLRSLRFPALVARTLAETGLVPHRLTIELTETALVSDDEEVARLLEAIRALGVRVAMDDFGTGYSSLSHLRRLPVDVIKIDRSFVASAEVDRNSMAVLRAIIQMGRDMEIATVGEGVETPAQRDILTRIGCNAGQGYLFGRPQALASEAEPPRPEVRPGVLFG